MERHSAECCHKYHVEFSTGANSKFHFDFPNKSLWIIFQTDLTFAQKVLNG